MGIRMTMGGFIDENGHFDVCEEYNPRMQILINMLWKCRTHDGYDSNGKYVAFV